MKSILRALPFLLLLVEASAQTGTEILFTKGAELEYKTYSSRAKGFSKLELYEATRITLIVTDVIDSNNVTYSYITKKGTGISNPEKDHYEKKLVLTRTSDNVITLPVNLYWIDTSYLADKYHDKKKMKGLHGAISLKGNDMYTFSVDLEKGKFNYSPRTVVMKIVVSDFMMQTTKNPNYNSNDVLAGKQGPTTTYSTRDINLVTTNYSITSTAKEYKVAGKAKITTPAGSFDCYKIVTRTELKMEKRTIEPMTVIYYHPEIGFIKWSEEDENITTGGLELVRMKR